MHVVFICIEAILLGAPYVFPSIPAVIGGLMFWGGIGVLVGYPVAIFSLRYQKAGRRVDSILQIIGLAGVVIFGSIALVGVVLSRYAVAPAEQPNTPQHTEKPRPKKFYSGTDKERLSSLLFKLGKLAQSDVPDLSQNARTAVGMWGAALKTAAFQKEIPKVIDKLEEVSRQSATIARTLDAIRKEVSTDAAEIDAVVSHRFGGGGDHERPIDFLQITINRFREDLRTLLTLKSPEQHERIVKLVDIQWHDLVSAADRLQNWSNLMKQEIEKLKAEF